MTEPLKLERGDVAAGLAASAASRSRARCTIGGQDHFYLEGQIALAIPGEDDDVTVYVLDPAPDRSAAHGRAGAGHSRTHAVTVNVRRMGGGFGGKETQGNLFAAVAALAAQEVRPRGQDPARPRRRHDRSPASATISSSTTRSAIDDDGRIQAVDAVYRRALRLLGRPLGAGDRPRAVPRATTAYFYPAVRRASREPLYTNTVSNTAFRGFGGPQGMIGGRALDRGDRLRAGQGPARDPQGQFLRRTEAATSRPTTRRSRTTSSTGWSTSSKRRRTIRRGAQAILAFNRTQPGAQARASR